MLDLTLDIIMPVFINENETLFLTQAAVDSFKNTDWKFRLIIIDNNSKLGGGYLREVADLYLREKENVGYPKAVNDGLKLSTSHIVAVANNDIQVSPNIFNVAREVLYDEGADSVHFRMVPYTDDFSYGKDVWMKGKERWCSSSFFCMRNYDYIRYDEGYGLGGFDDWDFWHNFRHYYNKVTAYTNRACYRHDDSHTLNKLDQNERAKRDKKNREYFKEKWGSYPEDIWMEKYPEQMKEPWKPFP
jgi:glycosyltransferase involved in cell wall biosynthesis